jgi:hypothetical protein
VAIIRCRGHQKGDYPEARGSRAADQSSRTVAIKPVGTLEIPPALSSWPNFIEQDLKLGSGPSN